MTTTPIFPTLIFPTAEDWEATRTTLHLYSRILSAVARVHADPHPMWWHVSLSVTPDRLVTDKMALPQGGLFWLELDLKRHLIGVRTEGEPVAEFSMAEGLTSTEMGNHVLAAIDRLGVTGKYSRDGFESDDPRGYDPQTAERFFQLLCNVEGIFQEHRAALKGEVGPVNFWTHGFDLSVEWYGTRMVETEEDGETASHPAQLNLGFYPGPSDSEAYFYSNPWPFDRDQLLDQTLPEGAIWHTDGWEGTMLPFAELVGRSNAEACVRTYARRVYEIASPTLTA